MERKNIAPISHVNTLGMFDFTIKACDGDDETLLIVGDRGYPAHFRVELLFRGVAYLACAPFFDGRFQFRMATEQEAAPIRVLADHPTITVYGIEEHFGAEREERKRTFFLAALDVQITLYQE